MDKRVIIASLAIALFGALVWLTDPFLLGAIGIISLLWIGLPATLLACVRLLFAFCKGYSRSPALTVLTAVAVYTLFMGLAFISNRYVHEQAVVAAKKYPVKVARLLETYRQTNGFYPSNLSEISSAPRLPWLLRRYGYRSDGLTYSFSFSQPGGLIDSWDYDSQTQSWHFSN